VTTDFSAPSAHALEVALSFFPHQTVYLLHAFQLAGSGVLYDPHRQVDGFRQTHVIELERFLASMSLPEEARRRLVTLVELGQPARLVREYVRDRGADLVVVGTHGRGAMLQALVGSTTKSILSTLPCDALVIRAPPAGPSF
jgi:nucleotide-binding universal stress UspA family protein